MIKLYKAVPVKEGSAFLLCFSGSADNGANEATSGDTSGDTPAAVEKTLLVPTDEYSALGAPKGVISGGTYSALLAAARKYEALRRGLCLLAYGDNTKSKLARKLKQKGFSGDEAAYAADRLAGVGYIDERAQLSREVELCLRKLYGRRKIAERLFEKSFPAELTDEMLDTCLENVDFPANCAELIRKKFAPLPDLASDRLARDKIVRAMLRFGYSFAEVRDALALLT